MNKTGGPGFESQRDDHCGLTALGVDHPKVKKGDLVMVQEAIITSNHFEELY